MKTKSKNDRKNLSASDEVLRRLTRAPETALKIYELAESLYMRDAGGAGAARLSLADIEQINAYLRETETDVAKMKKQFQDLATTEGSFDSEKIPIGF